MEYAHVSLDESRRLKAAVVTEQFRRLAGIDVAGVLTGKAASEPLPPGTTPAAFPETAWRTRVQLAVAGEGDIGARRSRSHEVVPLRRPPLASHAIQALDLAAVDLRGLTGIEIAAPAAASPGAAVLHAAAGTPEARIAQIADELAGRALSVLRAGTERPRFRHRAGGRGTRRGAHRTGAASAAGGSRLLHGEPVLRERPWRGLTVPELPDIELGVPADGFWQVHGHAPAVLTDRVLSLAGPVRGQRVADLYCGAGLLGLALASQGAEVLGIEASAAAVGAARRNAAAMGADARFENARIEDVLGTSETLRGLDTVVLDPPRAGAGRAVVEAIAAAEPDRVVYISCDAATLARDVAYFAPRGYALSHLEVLDLFPLTGHVECAALLERTGS
nr:RsmD family RNA methyltransferase [Sediminivirga luteola]